MALLFILIGRCINEMLRNVSICKYNYHLAVLKIFTSIYVAFLYSREFIEKQFLGEKSEPA
jgi:hypothetical protein